MTFSYRRLWDYCEREYREKVEHGRRRDAQAVIGLLFGLLLILVASLAFAGDGDPGSRNGGGYCGCGGLNSQGEAPAGHATHIGAYIPDYDTSFWHEIGVAIGNFWHDFFDHWGPDTNANGRLAVGSTRV